MPVTAQLIQSNQSAEPAAASLAASARPRMTTVGAFHRHSSSRLPLMLPGFPQRNDDRRIDLSKRENSSAYRPSIIFFNTSLLTALPPDPGILLDPFVAGLQGRAVFYLV